MVLRENVGRFFGTLAVIGVILSFGFIELNIPVTQADTRCKKITR